MRLLVVRFSAIGDCVMTAWAVTALRRAQPDARIVWAVQSRSRPVIDTERLVDRAHVFERERWKSTKWSAQVWKEMILAYTGLRGERFDHGFDFQGHSKTAMCLALAGCQVRHAAVATDGLARRLTRPMFDHPVGHDVERAFALVASVVPCTLPERPEMPSVDEAARRFQAEFGGSLVSIQTGAGEPEKRYPQERWEEVARSLAGQGYRVVALGGPGDPRLAAPAVVDLVGKTDLRGAMAVVAASRLHLAADTGTGHIAAALGVPVVSVFGKNAPERYRPYSPLARVLWRDRDPAAVRSDEVVSASLELLKEARALPH